jgi:hypothetical protein
LRKYQLTPPRDVIDINALRVHLTNIGILMCIECLVNFIK